MGDLVGASVGLFWKIGYKEQYNVVSMWIDFSNLASSQAKLYLPEVKTC